MKNPLNVCFLSDDAFIQHMTVAAASAADHASRPLTIWLVHPGLSRTSLDKIAQFEKMSRNLTIHLVECELQHFEKYPQSEKWPRLIYAKLMLANLLPVDRVIVLDCDVVVMDDLAKIYDLEFPAGIRLAACSDLATQRRLIERGLSSEHYFNGGVLIFDLEALRKEHFFPRVLEITQRVFRVNPFIIGIRRNSIRTVFDGQYCDIPVIAGKTRG